MKTQEWTEIKAIVLFPELKPAGGTYIPRQLLFSNGTVSLKGRWSADKVLSYCKMHARMQGYAPCELDIEYSYVDGEGDYFTAQVEDKVEEA